MAELTASCCDTATQASCCEPIGLDMTEEMLDLARANATLAGVENVRWVEGHIEEIPLPDASVDVVISNCVINLSGNKPRVLREVARVLKPGGRFRAECAVEQPPRAVWPVVARWRRSRSATPSRRSDDAGRDQRVRSGRAPRAARRPGPRRPRVRAHQRTQRWPRNRGRRTLAGILGYEERPLVSVDYKDDPRSAIVDALSTRVTDQTQVKVLAWYDNEWGYANRMVELAAILAGSVTSP